MSDIIARVLAWYYEVWPSYGGAIVLLTLTVMVLVLPLTLKSTRSMLLMQRLQPEIRKLQQQYRDDRQKLNEEMMALYRENKINPLSGCLPLLIQLPVFFVLYQVLRGLTRLGEDGTFNPRYLDHDSALYQALDGSTKMMSWGLDLARTAVDVAGDSLVSAIPYLLLILGVSLTTYVQQKQISARNPGSDTLSNPTQKMLLRIMPAFFAFISLNLPVALVVYFFASNLFRVGQQALISHAVYKPAVREGLYPPPKDDTAAPSDQAKPAKPAKVVDTTAKVVPPAKPDKAAKPAPKPDKAAKPAAAPAQESRGMFGRLLGGITGNGGSAPAKSAPAGDKGTSRPASGRVTPPASGRVTPPASGRVTPPGTGRTGGSAPRKKKRK